MTFSEVYERVIAYWPESISISDGRAVSLEGEHEPTPSTVPGVGAPWLFSTLSRTSDEVEDKIDHHTDTWGSMMVWTMFQVFHAEAKRLHEIGSDTLLTRAVDRTIIEEKYYENLHSEDWSEELAAYRRS
jgi:hypothetical protein